MEGAEEPKPPEQSSAPPEGSQPEEPCSPPAVAARVHGYDNLNAQLVLQTIERLHQRIQERFGQRSLAGICARLHEIGASATSTVEEIARPIIWVRVLTAMLVVLVVLGLLLTMVSVTTSSSKVLSLAEFVQALEAGINDVVLIGAGIFFLVTLETRMKRRRALEAVHELRSLVHIVDMHQLTKDPERLQPEHLSTESSPGDRMTPFEMNRYLDYCSEMLSLCAKLAALYAQNFGDPVVLQAVSEVETLAIGMTGNVWQKITILQTMDPEQVQSQA